MNGTNWLVPVASWAGRAGRASRIAAVAVTAAMITACGIPADTAVRGIDEKDVKFRLMDTSTTSTTSTTTTSTTTTIAPQPKRSTTTTTSTIPLRNTTFVSLFFVTGDSFVSEDREVAEEVTVADLVNLLVEGPRREPAAATRSRSVVQSEDVLSAELEAGVAVVELAPRFLELPVAEQRLLVGQLVLTLTSRPGVGQLRFVSGGKPVDVPRGDGTFGAQELSSDSFREFVQIEIPIDPQSPITEPPVEFDRATDTTPTTTL
jgi:spore germination protein GerM